ncbi:hypothetical protein [Kitasatospora sp. MBT66]|uniref:hypothetical protein n=1 Tax=Kitasatospora sp. MBT66 TaxID=1444769 RepID=UPI0005B7954B|nr:hypothetical protein [Kitasatospora sp. MBT66]
MNLPDRTEYRFEDHHVDGDALVLKVDKDGDVLISTHEGGEVVGGFYLRPDDVDALAVAVRRLGRTGAAHRTAVVAQPGPADIPPPVDPRTPEMVEAEEWADKAARRATFAESMLPAPGTEDRERAFIRATEMLGPSASAESRMEMARFLLGQSRWT